jgi:hypothetical protein
VTNRADRTRLVAVAAMLVPVILLAAWGCVRRIPSFSPRRGLTPDHLVAETREACLDCHPAATLRRHSGDDDCFACHPLRPGSTR